MADFILKIDAFDHVDKVLTEKGFIKKLINGNQGMKYDSPDGGNIDVYYKSGNVVIGGTQDKRDILKILFQELFSELHTTEPQKPVSKHNMAFKYVISASQLPVLKNEFERFTHENQYNLQEVEEEKAYYRLIITDSKKNRVTITQYKNLTLLIQGLESQLWLEVSDLIGSNLNITFQTVVAQVVAEPGEQVEVISIVTRNDQDKAESKVKARLGECYLFLYSHDRDAIEASEYMLDSGLQPKEYFGFISPTIRAIEGFAKKLLIEIKAFTEEEIRKPGNDRWNFSKVYDRDSRRLTTQVLECLSSVHSIRRKQEESIKDLIFRGINRIRNPYFHDGPPPEMKVINNHADARSIHDELLGLMVKVYECFKSELNK